MRKGKMLILSIVLLLLFVTACSTTVGVSYMRPSDVDMGKYRNIAIASTVPYKGYLPYPSRIRCLDLATSSIYIGSSYGKNLPKRVAEYATNTLVSALSQTGYYNILPPEMTDRYLGIGYIGYSPSKELIDAGYDAVMIPKIEDMDIDELIWAEFDSYKVDKDGNKFPVYEYYIKRIASITYSITVIDCKTDKIISKRTYQDDMVWTDDFDPNNLYFSVDAYYMFKSMINGFKGSILRNFVPSKVVMSLSLMSNKPKLANAEGAYEDAKNGNLARAYDSFIDIWNRNGHIPSGYNAALIKSALGDYDSSLSILSEMRESVVNADVEQLYRTVSLMKQSTAEAEAQIDGASTLGEQKESNNFSIYDYVMNN